MPTLSESYEPLRAALAGRLGRVPVATAPAADFDRLAGVLLSRLAGRTRSVELVQRLRDAGLSDPGALAATPAAEVAALLGVAPAESGRWLGPLQRLAAWFAERGEDAIADARDAVLRDELRAIRGLGATTVDSLLRDGLGRATFAVDRATARILARHGWLDESDGYDEARDRIEALDPDNAQALAELAGWLGLVAKRWCRPRRPLCEDCPLRPWLPAGGPLPIGGAD
jgi:endonuclease-3 related protein